MFVTHTDEVEARRAELFELLDDIDDSLFLEKAAEISESDIMCKARDKRKGLEGRTLLHNAARHGKLPAVTYLLGLGHEADVFDSSVSLVTPLMDAVTMGHNDVAVALVSLGANLFIQDMRGENVLHYCARNGSVKLIMSVIKAADISQEQIQALASTSNCKLKFPEDLTASQLTKEVLTDLREKGTHVSKSKQRATVRKKK